MDYKTFKKVIDESLLSYGFKRDGRNFWTRKGKEVSMKIHLQRSSFSNLYYFRAYYIINNLPLKGCTTNLIGHCFAHINLSEEDNMRFQKMCDLEYDISDDERINTLHNLISQFFTNYQYIETEKELKEMLINSNIPVFLVVKKYLGIDSMEPCTVGTDTEGTGTSVTQNNNKRRTM